jgi:hypothetical protein
MRLSIFKLIEESIPILAKDGFIYVKKRESFEKRMLDLTYRVSFTKAEENQGIRVIPLFFVRHESVEEIFHKVSGVPTEMQFDTATIGLGYNRIEGEDAGSYFVDEEKDIAGFGEFFVKAFYATGIHFFQKFSTLAELDKLLNDSPTEICNLRQEKWLRISTGLIVAKLTKRNNLDSLFATYRRQISDYSSGFFLERFERLVNLLEIEVH